MSGSRDRRDRDRRPSDRRDAQPDEEQQRRPGDPDLQESDSLTALKAILGKVASLLTGLQLNQDESISLVEQLYGSVLDMDLKLAGETDDKRKSMVLAHIQNTTITRNGGKLVVEYPKADPPKAPAEPVASAPVAPEPAPQPVAQSNISAASEPAQLVMAEPAAVEPAATQAAPVEPAAVEPAATQAAAVEPTAAEPAPVAPTQDTAASETADLA